MTSSPDTISRREAIKRTATLLGLALTPAMLSGVLQAQSAAVTGGATASAPRNLTAAQLATVAAISDRILPRTDTPGARDVGVPAFIDLMAGDYLTAAEKGTLVAGLADVETASTAAHRKGFAALTTDQQDALLRKIAESGQKKEKAFFQQIRDLTLLGYFTSEQVGKNVTHYDPIPGPYRGCLPISEVGNVAWTR